MQGILREAVNKHMSLSSTELPCGVTVKKSISKYDKTLPLEPLNVSISAPSPDIQYSRIFRLVLGNDASLFT